MIDEKEKDINEDMIFVYRFKYDLWKRFFPNTDLAEYEALQSPDSFITFCERNYKMGKANGSYTDETIVQAIPVHGIYGIDIEPDELSSNRVLTEEQITAMFKDFGLNHSIYAYALCVLGRPMKQPRTFRLSQKSVDTIKNYYAALINDPNYAIYVCPYVVDFFEYLLKSERFLQMAKDYFDNGVNVSYAEYENKIGKPFGNTNNSEFHDNPSVKFIPVFFREVHLTGTLTVGEIQQYANRDNYSYIGDAKNIGAENYERHLDAIRAHPGRFANKLILDNDILDEYKINRNGTNADEVLELLTNELAPYFAPDVFSISSNLTASVNSKVKCIKLLQMIVEMEEDT